MKNPYLIAAGMMCVLLLYGYLSSNAGHDHNEHGASSSNHEQGNHSH